MRYAATNAPGRNCVRAGNMLSHQDPAALPAKRVCRLSLDAIAAGDVGCVCLSEMRCIDSSTRVSKMRCLALASALAKSALVRVGARGRPGTHQADFSVRSALLQHARRGRGPLPTSAMLRVAGKRIQLRSATKQLRAHATPHIIHGARQSLRSRP